MRFAGVLASLSDGLARRPQLMERTFGKRQHPDFAEHVVGEPQLIACVDTALLATQPLAVEQVGAGVVGPESGSAEAFDGLSVVLFRCVVVADQRRQRATCPGPSRARSSWCSQRAARERRPPERRFQS